MNRAIAVIALGLAIVSCQMKVKPAIEIGIDECENCSMIIQDIDQGAVAIDQNEELHTFCNPVCLISEWNKLKKTPEAGVWSSYLFNHGDNIAMEADKAFIVQGDFRTAMGYGLLAFASEKSAGEFAREYYGQVISWNELRSRYETPDRTFEIMTRPAEPGIFEAMRGEIIAVIMNNNTDSDINITLSAHDFSMNIPARGRGSRSLVTDKPGEGFTFTDDAGNLLAMLRVGGEHTAEETLYK